MEVGCSSRIQTDPAAPKAPLVGMCPKYVGAQESLGKTTPTPMMTPMKLETRADIFPAVNKLTKLKRAEIAAVVDSDT